MKAAFVALALLATCAVSVQGQVATAPAPTPCLTVPQLATQAGLTSLLQAVELAGLTSTLSDPNLAVTLFAPSNDAFTELLSVLNLTSVNDLEADNELEPVLLYHVLSTPYTAAQLLADGIETTMYLNETLTFAPATAADGSSTVGITAFVGNATVTSADNVACNSLVHVIDEVLIPQLYLPNAPGEAPSAQAL